MRIFRIFYLLQSLSWCGLLRSIILFETPMLLEKLIVQRWTVAFEHTLARIIPRRMNHHYTTFAGSSIHVLVPFTGSFSCNSLMIENDEAVHFRMIVLFISIVNWWSESTKRLKDAHPVISCKTWLVQTWRWLEIW